MDLRHGILDSSGRIKRSRDAASTSLLGAPIEICTSKYRESTSFYSLYRCAIIIVATALIVKPTQ